MDHNSFQFRPRGIIKWHPFNAVDDMLEVQYEIDKINNIKPQPELSEDQLSELQRDLEVAVYNKHRLTVHYYIESKIETVTGFVSNVDYIEQRVSIAGVDIPLTSICYIIPDSEVTADGI